MRFFVFFALWYLRPENGAEKCINRELVREKLLKYLYSNDAVISAVRDVNGLCKLVSYVITDESTLFIKLNIYVFFTILANLKSQEKICCNWSHYLWGKGDIYKSVVKQLISFSWQSTESSDSLW